MSESICVSIIIPVFNCADHLQNSLGSLLCQSERCFEVIFIDDKSTDNSLEKLEEFTRAHPEINSTILINDVNCGEGGARNRGLSNAKGEFICFIDADDKVDKDFVKLMLLKISEGFDLVYSGFDIYNSLNGETIRFEDTKAYYTDSEKIIKHYLFARNHFAHVGVIYRRSFLEKNKIFYHVPCRFGVDIEFVCTVLLRAPRCSSVGKSLYLYIIRSESVSTSLTAEMISDCFDSLGRVQRSIPCLSHRLWFVVTRKAKTAYYLLEESFIQKIPRLKNRRQVLRLVMLSIVHVISRPRKKINRHSLLVLFNALTISK